MQHMRYLFICLTELVVGATFAQSPTGRAAQPAAVAIVQGKPILEDELRPLIEGDLRRLRFEEYQVRRRALDELIIRKLIEARAKQKGLGADEYLRQEIDEKLGEPTEAELQAYYYDQDNLSNAPYELIRSRLMPGLKQQRTEHARQEFFAKLREQAGVVVTVKPPRVEVAVDPARVSGNPDAPVTIVEFSDFQCPYCRKANATLRQVMDKYKDRVRIGFRDFPLTQIHPRALRAAEAARCAGRQAQFWAYHDLLFANPNSIGEEDLKQRARVLNLDMGEFEACLSDRSVRAQIEQDLRSGMQAGVSATPGFFINGILLSGAQPLSAFAALIDSELESQKTQRK
jgi:protein-disulfide isomerase